MRGLVGLKFILAHQIYLIASMPKNEAELIMHQWKSGAHKLKDIQVISGYCTIGKMDWALRISDIMGMHTVELIEEPQTQPQLTHSGLVLSRR
jgi:hypothetical protein